MDLKPIETVYNGYRFRSRLEARWAVYFDTLGIEYEYEKEGYDLGEAGYYLPDFWLPQIETWAEVKGKHFTSEEDEKIKKLALVSKCRVIKLDSIPECIPYDAYIPVEVPDEYVLKYGCKWFLQPHEYYMYIRMKNNEFAIYDGTVPREYAPIEITNGVNAARSARFEHGERPKIKNKIKKVIPKPAKVEKREILPPVRVPVVLKNKIVNEIDVVRACVEEGYQITQRIVDEILSYENPTDVLEYLLNNVGDTDFILEPETVDLSGYKEDYEYFSSDDFNEEWNRFLEDDERYEKKCEEYLKEKLNHYAWVNKPNGIPDRLFVDIMDEACSYMWWPGDANEKIKDGWWSKIIEVNRDNKAFYGENSFL